MRQWAMALLQGGEPCREPLGQFGGQDSVASGDGPGLVDVPDTGAAAVEVAGTSAATTPTNPNSG